jgi:hypothetical protein
VETGPRSNFAPYSSHVYGSTKSKPNKKKPQDTKGTGEENRGVTTATTTISQCCCGWHCTSGRSLLSPRATQATYVDVYYQPLIDRRSLEHLVDTLDNVDSREVVIQIPELRFTVIELSSDATDGGLNVLKEFFARRDTTLTKVTLSNCTWVQPKNHRSFWQPFIQTEPSRMLRSIKSTICSEALPRLSGLMLIKKPFGRGRSPCISTSTTRELNAEAPGSFFLSTRR